MKRFSLDFFAKQEPKSFFEDNTKLALLKAITALDIISPHFKERDQAMKLLRKSFNEKIGSGKERKHERTELIKELHNIYRETLSKLPGDEEEIRLKSSKLINRLNAEITSKIFDSFKLSDEKQLNNQISTIVAKISTEVKMTNFAESKKNINAKNINILKKNIEELLLQLNAMLEKNEKALKEKVWDNILISLKARNISKIHFESIFESKGYPSNKEELDNIFDPNTVFESPGNYEKYEEKGTFNVRSHHEFELTSDSSRWQLSNYYKPDDLKVIKQHFLDFFGSALQDHSDLINETNELKKQIATLKHAKYADNLDLITLQNKFKEAEKLLTKTSQKKEEDYIKPKI